MKKILFVGVALCVLASCTDLKVRFHHDEPLVKERRTLSGFERIELLGALDVKYHQADSFSVVVEAPVDIVRYVETRMDGNKLVVNMKWDGKVVNFGVRDAKDVTVYVTSPDFLGVELKGSGDFDCKRHLDTDHLDIQLKGSGDIEFGDVICDDVHMSLVGSGDVEVKKIVTRQAAVELVGSGDVKVCFSESGQVKARLLGSGDITLKGDVARCQQTVRGSGDMHISGLTVRTQ